MIKTFTISTILTGMYASPTYFLIAAICLVFAIDLYNRYLDSKKISCAPFPDLTTWSYADINTLARLHKLKAANRKKLTLIQLLQEV